ncbi:hypothetical protein [Kitasatospora sp. NPDC008115]|uniref:hypothetical protein n=1 Tax=Kitasatospora sp. NPDC008115 TaxID=3364022 RepID=UPI0036ECB328
MRQDAAPPSRDPRRREAGAGARARAGAGAALVLLLLTALGLIGHHTLPAGVTAAPHTATAMTAAAHRPAATHQHPATVGHRAPAVAEHPVRACAEHRVCSSTVPARGVLLDGPPQTGLAVPGTGADPAPHRRATAPGTPWPGAPPPDLDVLSVSRR